MIKKTRKTSKRQYCADVFLKLDHDYKYFWNDLRKCLKIKNLVVMKEAKEAIDDPLGSFNFKPFLNRKGFERFFERNFNKFIEIADPYDEDIKFIDIEPDSVIMTDINCIERGLQLSYNFDVRINLGKTDLFNFLKDNVLFDTEDTFIKQAIPNNKTEVAAKILKLAKTSNLNWSVNKKNYSSEDKNYAINLIDSINPLDEDNLKNFALSEPTKDFLFQVYGKNFYLDNLFNLAMCQIAYYDKGPTVDEILYLADQESILENNIESFENMTNNIITARPVINDEVKEQIQAETLYQKIEASPYRELVFMKHAIYGRPLSKFYNHDYLRMNYRN